MKDFPQGNVLTVLAATWLGRIGGVKTETDTGESPNPVF